MSNDLFNDNTFEIPYIDFEDIIINKIATGRFKDLAYRAIKKQG